MGGPWSLSEPGVLDIPDVGGAAVAIVLVGGSLAVLTGQGRDARVEVSRVAGPPLAVSFDGRTLRIEHHKEADGSLLGGLRRMLRERAYPSADVAVTVPPDTAVRVTTVTAGVYAAELGARLSVTTGSGAVATDRIAGDLDLKTGVGAIAVRRSAARRIALVTVGGALEVDLAEPDCLLTARGAGSLAVTAPPTGLDLTATTRGAVLVDGREIVPDDVQDALSGDEAPGEPAKRADVPARHHADGDRALVVKAKLRSGAVRVDRADHVDRDDRVHPHVTP